MTHFVLALPILLFSVVAHEYAHAWTAFREGDDTAYALGRLTLNSLPHIDPVMSVLFPLGLYVLSHGAFTFGAAKPVPITPRKFRRYVRGDLIVSSAGIVTNLALGIACAALFALAGLVGHVVAPLAGSLGVLQWMCAFGVMLNFTLAVFNLVPVPPLDGSHLLYHALPPAWGARYRQLGRFGFAVIFLMFLVPGLWNVVLWPVDLLVRGALTLVAPYALPELLR